MYSVKFVSRFYSLGRHTFVFVWHKENLWVQFLLFCLSVCLSFFFVCLLALYSIFHSSFLTNQIYVVINVSCSAMHSSLHLFQLLLIYSSSFLSFFCFCSFHAIFLAPAPPRKTRGELYKDVDADYYGYRDEDDGVLVPLEQDTEKEGKNKICLSARKTATEMLDITLIKCRLCTCTYMYCPLTSLLQCHQSLHQLLLAPHQLHCIFK